MRIEYDRDTCIGMFQCVAEWDAFERDESAGKAVLADGESSDADWGADVRVREVPDGEELDAKFAARTCPVDAIRLYDDDGDRVV
jgi:ferredoxin